MATKLMQGTAGWEIDAVDATGAELETLASQPAKPGANVTLTLDPAVQKAAEAALAGYTGPGGAGGDPAVDRRDPGRGAEPAGQRAGPDRADRALPTGFDLQGHHRDGRLRTVGGHSDHRGRLPRRHHRRLAPDPQLRQLPTGHRLGHQGIREVVQHDLRQAGHPDAGGRTDQRRLPVRDRPRLRRAGHHHADRKGAGRRLGRAEGRERIRSGRRAGDAVRTGADGGDGGQRCNADAHADPGRHHHGRSAGACRGRRKPRRASGP